MGAVRGAWGGAVAEDDTRRGESAIIFAGVPDITGSRLTTFTCGGGLAAGLACLIERRLAPYGSTACQGVTWRKKPGEGARWEEVRTRGETAQP